MRVGITCLCSASDPRRDGDEHGCFAQDHLPHHTIVAGLRGGCTQAAQDGTQTWTRSIEHSKLLTQLPI